MTGGSRIAVGLAACGVLLLGGPACERESVDRQPLAVYAASSLTEAFQELEAAFEAASPNVDVLLTFSGSQVLRLQIEEGAPADVFASANREHVQVLIAGGHVADSEVFAHNELAVIMPRDNPAGIATFADLPRARRLVIGTRNVPVGAYTREALQRARATLGDDFADRVLARVVSEESNVRLVRAKVELGEADAAVVYRSDAVASERVAVVPIPAEVNLRAEYHVGILGRTEVRPLAEAWVAFVRSREGRAILTRHGFVLE